jgi:hypothetical protein
MNSKSMSSWAGPCSILWMLGGYAFLAFVASPHNLYFQPMWLSMLIMFSAWLGIGLLLAVAGLRRGNIPGRVCAAIGVVLFLLFAWLTVSPAFTRAQQRGRTNQSVEPTGGSRYGQSVFASLGRLPPVAHARRSPNPRPKDSLPAA